MQIISVLYRESRESIGGYQHLPVDGPLPGWPFRQVRGAKTGYLWTAVPGRFQTKHLWKYVQLDLLSKQQRQSCGWLQSTWCLERWALTGWLTQWCTHCWAPGRGCVTTRHSLVGSSGGCCTMCCRVTLRTCWSHTRSERCPSRTHCCTSTIGIHDESPAVAMRILCAALA